MTNLITGAGGFVGQHLAAHLRAAGEDVLALDRASCDVLDVDRLGSVFAKVRPRRIFHLAGQSLPGQSWSDPKGTFRVNVEGTLNVLEAARAAESDPAIVVACSSSEYRVSQGGRPIKETDPMQPSSPYAASKLAADHCALLYGLRYKLNIFRVRPFFLIGPRKTGDVCSDLARRVVAVERGIASDVVAGRLDVVRDFLDVRDGVEAMVVIAQRGAAGEDFNICSGHGYRIGDVLEGYRKLSKTGFRERSDPTLMRQIEEPVKVGDATKLKALGWSPRYSFEESLAAILEYWRGQP